MSIFLGSEERKSFHLDIPKDQSPAGKDRSFFMDAYAMGARWHMSRFGSTQAQLAAICAKTHWHVGLMLKLLTAACTLCPFELKPVFSKTG